MEAVEFRTILYATVTLAAFSGLGEYLHLLLDAVPPDKHPSVLLFRYGWPILEAVVLSFGCLALIWWYKKRRVGCYPSTFLYCFVLPEASNPSGQSRVVGYCHIHPEMESGEIIAAGASFSWRNGRLDDRVGFTSTQVRGTKEQEETTCHIRYDINREDWGKRFYRHGLLQFRLVKSTNHGQRDVYAGYMRSTAGEELQGVEVEGRGYAEWHAHRSLDEQDTKEYLVKSGQVLHAKLETLLQLEQAFQPTLWKARAYVPSYYKNNWGEQIPTPQSVILNPRLRPHIDRLLDKVLTLIGLNTTAVERFKELAAQKAQVDLYDPLVAYERDLKAGLIGMAVRNREAKVLAERAKTIYDEIRAYFIGESLLDIGCGNGLIANFARRDFSTVQLLDVVEYVTPGLNIPFQLYKEGSLPTRDLYDTVLLLTVLHHSNNPVELLKSAWAVTRQRLIIIESVVGIHRLEPPAKYELIDLPDEDQVAYAAFVDWFYNRVLHDDVPVPYNYATPDKWKSIFLECGMHLTQTVHLGQDIDIGPEYHILFVLEKREGTSQSHATQNAAA
jgi:SAM-dependent methyltransferase